ncbi:MAG: FliM/FliN family flagellar motor switch protein [Sphingomonas sp.]
MARVDVPVRGATSKSIARAWLPDAAIRALDIDAALADISRAWSRKWFARHVVRPLETQAVGAVPLSDEIEWLQLDRDVAIGVPSTANAILAGLMLDLEVPREPLTSADNRLLAGITQACIDDLCRRMAETFRLDAGARWIKGDRGAVAAVEAPMSCALGVEAHLPLVRILVANDALVGLAKAALPPFVPASHLSSLAQGLAAQCVAVTAQIGRCKLTLAEFAELGIGDVLVFDHSIDSPLDLLVNGRGAPIAQCAIGETDGRVDLTLLDTIGG